MPENRPAIRSFVRREGRITQAQKNALHRHQNYILVNQADELGEWFDNQAPQYLEIGFGQGENLVHMAQRYPEHKFLGVEVYRPGIGSCLCKLHQQQIHNVRICQADSVELLALIADNSLHKILIFFPDPWPKLRHHKRRLIQQTFVSLLSKKLKPEGILHLATDWENYAEQMLNVLHLFPEFINMTPSGYAERPAYRTLTRFENRGLRLGHPIRDMLFQKTGVKT